MNIVVVDDEEDIKLLFEYRFRKEIKNNNLILHYFESVDDAIKFIIPNHNSIKCIFSDINMPNKDGFDLIREIRTIGLNTKIVMVSAYSDRANKDRSLESGADGFVSKPINFEMIRTILDLPK